MITIPEIEDAIGIKTDEWPGDCHTIACSIIESGLVNGTDRYGLYLGYINPNSIFGGRIARHGWIELEDETVIDPTRWVFECEDPYVYYGTYDDGEYDIGGNDLKAITRRAFPTFNKNDIVYDVPNEVSFGLDVIVGFRYKQLCLDQIIWLSNCHPETLGPCGRYIFNWINDLGKKALIPIDNWKLVME